MRRWVVLVLLLLAPACAPAPGPAGSSRPVEPYVQSVDVCGKAPDDVPKLPARQSTVPAPADLRVSSVLLCSEGMPSPSGQREHTVRRAVGPAGDLLAALRLPSATKHADVCTTEMLLPIYLAVITTDGRVVAPAIPVDGCGKPRREVLAALRKLSFP